ncbi:MAG: efflux RND transporter permease subunit [Verrucomicrobiaceae bacterium]|nr:efflux RND transporter permease subunit [Verrucomicrobiaceae bacterium]
MKSVVEWFSRNHIAANFLMYGLLLVGGMSWFTMRKEIFPDLSVNMVVVKVPYPNATPEEVERGVCVPIEEATQDLASIKRVQSIAAESMGVVSFEVKTGYNVRDVMADIKTRVDAIDNFSEEAEKPTVDELVIKNQILSVAISADTDEATLQAMAERVRDDLLVYKGGPKSPVSSQQWGPADTTHVLMIAVLVLGLILLATGFGRAGGPLTAACTVLILARMFFWDTSSWEMTMSRLNEKLAATLSGDASITQVEIAGAKPYEISIEVSEETLRTYGLTLDRVAAAVKASSLDLPAGSVRTDGGEVLIRTQNKKYRAPDFETITVVTRPDGSVVKLSDIAKIVDGFEDVDLFSRFDGRPTKVVNVFRTGDEDTLRLVNLVKGYLAESRERMPASVRMDIWNDNSKWLKGRMDLMFSNGLQGFVLIVIVLGLFLEPKLAWYVSLGIPVSVAGGLLVMPFADVSINMISLFAFILVLGVVVDDAIVIGENVYHRMSMGEPPHLASPRGTNEVAMVVTFGVLVTVMAFTPMFMVSGVSGKIWRQIPWVVVPVLLISTIESKLILPAHLATLKPRSEKATTGFFGLLNRVQHGISDGLDWVANHWYKALVKRAVEWRYTVLACFIAMFILTIGLIASGFIKFQFFPKVEGDVLVAKLVMPEGVPVEVTQQAVAQMERGAAQIAANYKDRNGQPVVKHQMATIGGHAFKFGFQPPGKGNSVHLGEVVLELCAGADRDLTCQQLIAKWREFAGPIPGAVELTFREATERGGVAIDLELSGPDLDQLRDASEYVKSEIAKFKGMADILDNDHEGKREIKLNILPQAETLGLRLFDVARQVRQAFYGEEVQRLQRGRDEVKVMVRYPKQERLSLDNMERMKIRTADGTEVPFAEVATADYGRGYSSIQRTDRRRAINVTSDIDRTVKEANSTEVAQELAARVMPEMQRKFPGVLWRFQGEQSDQNEAMRELLIGGLLSLFGIYVLLAVPLKSYLQPAIVMSVIPFGMVGAVLGHALLGFDLSIMSFCGIIALSGMVVNESLVLTDCVNRFRKRGMALKQAAWSAGISRFRSIMATSVTTFVGLVPIMSETDIQALFLVPMSVALGFGGLFATMITLLLVPGIYVMLEDFRRLAGMGEGVVADDPSAVEDVDATPAVA